MVIVFSLASKFGIKQLLFLIQENSRYVNYGQPRLTCLAITPCNSAGGVLVIMAIDESHLLKLCQQAAREENSNKRLELTQQIDLLLAAACEAWEREGAVTAPGLSLSS